MKCLVIRPIHIFSSFVYAFDDTDRWLEFNNNYNDNQPYPTHIQIDCPYAD